MKKLARRLDRCSHGGFITGACSTVLAEGFHVARIEDPHTCPSTEPSPHKGGIITTGCPTVLVEGKPVARELDLTLCTGVSLTAPITTGCGNVFIDGTSLVISEVIQERINDLEEQARDLRRRAERLRRHGDEVQEEMTTPGVWVDDDGRMWAIPSADDGVCYEGPTADHLRREFHRDADAMDARADQLTVDAEELRRQHRPE
jgi:uncharacterized Zn-binding protein involved in type VI secretion